MQIHPWDGILQDSSWPNPQRKIPKADRAREDLKLRTTRVKWRYHVLALVVDLECRILQAIHFVDIELDEVQNNYRKETLTLQ